MLKSKIFILSSVGMLIIPQAVSAGFFDTVMDKVERSVDKRVEKRTNKAVENSLDKVEQGFDDTIEGKNKKGQSPNDSLQDSVQDGSSDKTSQAPSSPKISWSRFDFVPGDTVIFEDAPSVDEENGEFPSRWDLHKGNAEIVELDGQNVIMLDRASIVPYIEDANKDYLPDVFTLEFDAYFNANVPSQRYFVSFYDRKNQRKNKHKDLTVHVNALEAGDSEEKYPGKQRSNRDSVGGWRHISIAFTKGKLKAYMDDTRLINIPHYRANPTGLTIKASSEGKNRFIKNIRLAKGGVKYYDRVLADGKIIVNGIRFDVNKATLKPESSGPINKIYKLMKKYPDIKFRVEGHTDSDGDAKSNLTLSQKRSEAVMQRLISMGISSDRLEAKGKGETSPIDNNGTPEGKANNRRVEFIKL